MVGAQLSFDRRVKDRNLQLVPHRRPFATSPNTPQLLIARNCVSVSNRDISKAPRPACVVSGCGDSTATSFVLGDTCSTSDGARFSGLEGDAAGSQRQLHLGLQWRSQGRSVDSLVVFWLSPLSLLVVLEVSESITSPAEHAECVFASGSASRMQASTNSSSIPRSCPFHGLRLRLPSMFCCTSWFGRNRFDRCTRCLSDTIRRR